MIPRFKPYLGKEELLAALRLPRKDDVERFECAFAELMGQRHALAFPYGRTGLMLLLEALGLKDKEIICPAYTCVVVPHAIVYSGNTPVFIDCEQGGFNMDLDLAEKAITDNTGAIIATLLFGYPVNLDRLHKIRNCHPNIYIIQDCAHSFAAEWKGRPVQKEGVAAIFGLNISKLMTSIFGGMITMDDRSLYEKLKKLRNKKLKKATWKTGLRRVFYLMALYPTFWGPVYGFVNRLERSGLLDHFVQYYDPGIIDMPSDFMQHMSPVEARVGMIQVYKYQDMIHARQKYAAYYRQRLQDDKFIKIPDKIEGATYSQIIALIEKREVVLKAALKLGVQLGAVLEYCIPNMTVYKKWNQINKYPNASYCADHVVNLPVWGVFEEKDAQKVVNVLKTVLTEMV